MTTLPVLFFQLDSQIDLAGIIKIEDYRFHAILGAIHRIHIDKSRFLDSTNYSALFKKYNGLTPSEYRRSFK